MRHPTTAATSPAGRTPAVRGRSATRRDVLDPTIGHTPAPTRAHSPTPGTNGRRDQDHPPTQPRPTGAGSSADVAGRVSGPAATMAPVARLHLRAAGVGGRTNGNAACAVGAGPGPAVAAAPGDGARLAPRVPLELVGLRRDDARLLVARRSDERLVEARFADLTSFLDAGDVIVVNTSATRPAGLVVDDQLVVHLSTELAEGLWSVELRHLCGNGSTPWLDYRPEGPIALPGGGQLELLEPYRPAGRGVPGDDRLERPDGHRPASRQARPTAWTGQPTSTGSSGIPDRSAGAADQRGPDAPVRLWTAELRLPRPLDEHLADHGRPIRYGCNAGGWSLGVYQTVFADEPGSAEMPSAARGFTPELVTRLVSKGVVVAPVLLHTGVASQEAGEPPYPERYRVGEATAAIVNNAKGAGHRIIAVGTTATRAIETVAHPDGTVRAGAGWTDLVITPERGVHAVDGLITGWHDPEASHLLLVEAVGGPDIIDRSYTAALDAGFAGHEFGDFHLILP